MNPQTQKEDHNFFFKFAYVLWCYGLLGSFWLLGFKTGAFLIEKSHSQALLILPSFLLMSLLFGISSVLLWIIFAKELVTIEVSVKKFGLMLIAIYFLKIILLFTNEAATVVLWRVVFDPC